MTDRCKKCGAEKVLGVRHSHCSGCGALLGMVAHSKTCPKAGLPVWAVCPQCRMLLAAGAACPTHGSPV